MCSIGWRWKIHSNAYILVFMIKTYIEKTWTSGILVVSSHCPLKWMLVQVFMIMNLVGPTCNPSKSEAGGSWVGASRYSIVKTCFNKKNNQNKTKPPKRQNQTKKAWYSTSLKLILFVISISEVLKSGREWGGGSQFSPVPEYSHLIFEDSTILGFIYSFW